MKKIACLFLMVIALPLVGAFANDAGPIFIAQLPQGADQNQVLNIVQRAFHIRSWKISGTTQTSVTGELDHNGYDAKITIYLDGASLRYSDATTSLVSTGAGTHAPKVLRQVSAPARWIENLRSDVTSQLILLSNSKDNQRGQSADPAERLRTLKRMLDDGLISQQEFDGKKSEILRGL